MQKWILRIYSTSISCLKWWWSFSQKLYDEWLKVEHEVLYIIMDCLVLIIKKKTIVIRNVVYGTVLVSVDT